MKNMIIAGLLTSVSFGAFAQDAEEITPFGASHKPNEYTTACLKAPSRDCAFSAALQTVIAEEFGLERSKVLVSVARAMIETGKVEDALQTLTLAMDEARSVNLSLVLQSKITEVAPLMARAGDTAGALALVEELNIPPIREDTLVDIARESVKAGRVSDATVALSQMKNQQRAVWQLPRLLPLAPASALRGVNLLELEEKMRAVEQSSQFYGGLVQLSVAARKRGDDALADEFMQKADAVFETLGTANARSLAAAFRLKAEFDGDMPEAMTEASYALVQEFVDTSAANGVRQTAARQVGPFEAQTGRVEVALARLEAFEGLKERASYFASLASDSASNDLVAEQEELLNEIAALEGLYERDLLKLTILENAVASGAAERALKVVALLEDDDNQALGLALVAPLLR